MKLHIPENIIEEVRSRADIVEVISELVLLKRTGKNHKGLCPFHSEKTPSFTVSADKQIYHCFGCGAGGNVFKFLMEFEEIPFVEAVKKLAERTHVEIPTAVQQGINRAPKGERENLLKANQCAANYFISLLNDPETGKDAREYLESRQFDGESAARYQVGWSSPAWRDMLIQLEKKDKISRKEIEKAGLAIKKEDGTESDYYDRFRGRLIIPLKDMHGNIIGFAGRVLKEGNPKYLNSPETPLYTKGNHLFGLDGARESIRKRNQVIIVEGYFDQMRAHQHGIKNVVAACGTALTPAQVNLLKNHASNAVMVFDSDPAGQKAAERGFALLLEQGMTVKTVILPEGQDPDSFILSQGSDAFLEQIENASLFIESYIRQAIQKENIQTPQGRTQLVNHVLPILSIIKNSVERSEWVKRLSELAGVEDKALLAELNRALNQRRPMAPESASSSKYGNKQNPELYLVQLLFADENLAEEIQSQVLPEEFQDPTLRQIVEAAYGLQKDGHPVQVGQLLDRIEQPEAREVLTRISLRSITFENAAKTTADCILEIKKRRVDAQKKDLKKQRNEAIQAGQMERGRELENQLREIQLSFTSG